MRGKAISNASYENKFHWETQKRKRKKLSLKNKTQIITQLLKKSKINLKKIRNYNLGSYIRSKAKWTEGKKPSKYCCKQKFKDKQIIKLELENHKILLNQE